MDFTYILTLLSLALYALFSYYRSHCLIAIHTLYLILIVIYISINPQQSSKFNSYHIKTTLPQKLNTKQLKNNSNTEKQSQKVKNAQNICKLCNKIKPPRYYHCRRCNQCIYQMDHHCDWLSCCVGQFNFKLYLHILCHFQILSILCIFMVGQQMYQNWDTKQWITVSIVLRLTFVLFIIWQCTKMLLNYWEMVKQNQTLIQSYKKVKGQKKAIIHKLQQIFGDKLNIIWFLPTFASGKYCNIFQQAFATNKSQKQQIPQYNYADQYMYGPDDLDDKFNDIKTQ